MKLIVETSYDIKAVINESSNSSSMYIEGIFSTADNEVLNGRIYKKSILEREANKLLESKIKNNHALGELEHPSRPNVDLSEAAIKIEELHWDGNNLMGKAKVLSTPKGQILRSLIEDGVTVGVSSRGLGTVNKNRYVNEDFNLITWDVVSTPSNQTSWMNGIYEGADYMVNESGLIVECERDIVTLEEANEKYNDYIKNTINDIFTKLK